MSLKKLPYSFPRQPQPLTDVYRHFLPSFVHHYCSGSEVFCRLSSNIQTASVAGYRRRRCAGWSFSLSCTVDTRSLSSPPRNMCLEFQLCVFKVNSPPPPPPHPPITRVPDCVCEWKNLDDRARHFSLTPWRLSLLSSHDASQIFASNLVACTPWITQASVNLMSNNFAAEIANFEVQRLQS